MAAEIVVVDLDLDLDGDYERFIRVLRRALADHPHRDDYIAKYGAWLEDHPLLPVQRPREPARWMHINLKFQDFNETIGTTIAVRDDNVYLIGFRNGSGTWYEFGLEGKSGRFIQGSTFLGCDPSYGSLVGDSDKMMKLSLGKYDAKSAVRKLWAYERVVPADAGTKRDLARMCVMICESARMIPHYETVNADWKIVSSMNLQHVNYIHRWSKMSCALITCAEEDPENLHTREELAVVHLLLNSPAKKGTQRRQQHEEQSPPPGGGGPSPQRPGSDPQLPQTSSSRPASSSSGGTQQQGRTAGNSVRGRPLVEVLSVEAEQGVDIDTIIVFDGKRGQIIYKHDDHDEYRPRAGSILWDLRLTGPYRAISSEGSFVIQVDGIIPGTDSRGNSSKVSGDLYWDCYAEDVDYDAVWSTCIISKDTGHRMAWVAYAVLSEAVEATVEVNLLLPGITCVYGGITAECVPLEGRNRVDSGVDRPQATGAMAWGVRLISVGNCSNLSTLATVAQTIGPGRGSGLPTPLRLEIFRAEQDRKVELVPSSDDSSMVPLELARSVIAVSLHGRESRLQISVGLHTVTPNDGSDVPLEGDIDFDFDKHTGEIRVESYADIFVPPVGTDPADGCSPGATASAGHQGTDEPTSSVQQCKLQVNVTSPGFHMMSPRQVSSPGRPSPTSEEFRSISG